MEGLCGRRRWRFLRVSAKAVPPETGIFTKRRFLLWLLNPVISENAARFLRGTVLEQPPAEMFHEGT